MEIFYDNKVPTIDSKHLEYLHSIRIYPSQTHFGLRLCHSQLMYLTERLGAKTVTLVTVSRDNSEILYKRLKEHEEKRLNKNNSKKGPTECDLDEILEQKMKKMTLVSYWPREYKTRPICVNLEGNERYSAWLDLYSLGYHLTDGEKYGADFLVYEKNPDECHSTYICKIVKNETIFDILPLLRISNTVNKTLLLWNNGQFSQIDFMSVQ